MKTINKTKKPEVKAKPKVDVAVQPKTVDNVFDKTRVISTMEKLGYKCFNDTRGQYFLKNPTSIVKSSMRMKEVLEIFEVSE